MAWIEDLVEFAAHRIDDRAREVLWERGVSEDQIRDFHFGYLDAQLPPLTGPGYDLFLKWSLGGAKLADVLVIPLTNPLGEIRGVQFRSVDREKKIYSDFILEKAEPVLFGLGQAMPSIWSTRSIYLVEGAFDWAPLQRVVPNVVATLTARVSEALLRTLRRVVDDVYFVYDLDATGRRSCEKFEKEYGGEFGLHFPKYPQITLPNGKKSKDLGELWEGWGDDRFSEYFRTLA